MSNEKNLRKFLNSNDEGMITMGLSMAKGFKLSDKILPKILGFYFWSDNAKIRSSSRSLFFQNATPECATIIKENWQPKIRTLKKAETVKPLIIKLVDSIKGTYLHSLELFIPALQHETDSWDDKRKAFLPVLETFGLSSEPVLFKLAKGDNSSLILDAFKSLGRIGNLQTALKLSRTRVRNSWHDEASVKACLKILTGMTDYSSYQARKTKGKVKKEYYTTNKKELDGVEKWLNLKISKNYAKELCKESRELARLSFKILENSGKTKFEICKLALNGHGRNHALDVLSNINTPECLELILNLSHDDKNFFKDNIERVSFYNAIEKLRIHLKKNQENKFKDMLLSFLKLEMNRNNYEFNTGGSPYKSLPSEEKYGGPIKILTSLSNYKETTVINSLIAMLPLVCEKHPEFASKFVQLLKDFSTKSEDSLLNSIADFDFNPKIFSFSNVFRPDYSRSIYAALLSITEDFDRLDFFLDPKKFSFAEKIIMSNSTKYSFPIKVRKKASSQNYQSRHTRYTITLTEDEQIIYKKARKSRSKEDISLLIRMMLGSSHHLYKSYHTQLENQDSRKFLYSDDPATRMMGLSLFKGNKCPDSVKPIIYSIYLFDTVTEIREKATELVKDFDLTTVLIPTENDIMHFLASQPITLFQDSAYYRETGDSKPFINFLDNLISINDRRLLPYAFNIFELLNDDKVCSYFLDILVDSYPSETYDYISNFMNVKGGLNFRKKESGYYRDYYSYTRIVSNQSQSFKYKLMISKIPTLDPSFDIEPLFEFAYTLRLDSKEETSKSSSTQRRLSSQLDLFEETVIAVSELDVSSTILLLSKKDIITIPERTIFAHFLNIMYLYSKKKKGQEYSKACLKIKELAEPHLKDRSIHVRNYLKKINEI